MFGALATIMIHDVRIGWTLISLCTFSTLHAQLRGDVDYNINNQLVSNLLYGNLTTHSTAAGNRPSPPASGESRRAGTQLVGGGRRFESRADRYLFSPPPCQCEVKTNSTKPKEFGDESQTEKKLSSVIGVER
ncbi:hypothetical protein C8F04DRAFT_1085058 [Mycena alexandri]|uniref:Uncharacterized protein n=1 Tax=Mycena alexandri TaxID=1745969 RepID=A0AAD6X9G8_9AGAR|nr:hypothetical protein C8F04DRAFT_1085058 [Mycena alexandri]